MAAFQDGGGNTTRVGYVNDNRQQCLGHRGRDGNDYLQKAYKMKCLCCGYVYGANGSDVFQRKCPECQGGKVGIDF